MDKMRHGLRDERGRFVASGTAGTELKRARGDRAGGRPQIRAKHKRALTRAEIETFLLVLAGTCNVSLAARETGRPARLFYLLRQRDADFRAAWAEALREGYELLELELLQRCRFGTPKDVFYQGRKTATTRQFNEATALRLLHFHRKTVAPMRAADERRAPDAKAIFDQLAARVAEIRAQAAKKGGGSEDEQA